MGKKKVMSALKLNISLFKKKLIKNVLFFHNNLIKRNQKHANFFYLKIILGICHNNFFFNIGVKLSKQSILKNYKKKYFFYKD